MRKIFAVSLAALLCLSLIALAGDNQDNSKAASKTITGTITRVDTAGKMLTVKDTSGNETTVHWNDSTKISGGDLQEGAAVRLSASDSGGNLTATAITVRTAKSY